MEIRSEPRALPLGLSFSCKPGDRGTQEEDYNVAFAPGALRHAESFLKNMTLGTLQSRNQLLFIFFNIL